jgi:hypothetical protein
LRRPFAIISDKIQQRPAIEKVTLAEAKVQDLDGQIDRLYQMVRISTSKGYLKTAMAVADIALRR